MVKAKFGNLEFSNDGKLVLSVSPVDSSHCMEYVSKQLVEMAAASGRVIDIDKYLPVLKQRVADQMFVQHGILREIIEDVNVPGALEKFDAALARARNEYLVQYEEDFGDAQPEKPKRARTVFESLNAVLAQAAADNTLREERAFLKAL